MLGCIGGDKDKADGLLLEEASLEIVMDCGYGG